MSPISEKIVIVDDEKRMCDSLAALLEGEGYEVKSFQNSLEAAEFIKKNKTDLVITDIKMPGQNGLELLKIVKFVDNDIPVILLTGYASLDTAIEAIAFGAYDYLMKPVEFTKLELAVKRALEKRRSDLARFSLLEELKISNLILNRRIGEINALYEAGKSIGSTSNLKDLLRQIVALASNVTDAKVGSIMLIDERAKYLTIEAAIGLDKKILDSTRLPIGESIAGSVALSGEPLIIDNVEKHSQFKRISKERYGSASLLCAPLKIKNKIIGVINMAKKEGNENFDSNDLRMLTTFAAQAAIAVDDASQFERKRRRLIEFEILHEMSKEMQGVNSLSEFREMLFKKLERVFPIDYSIWLNWDKENKIFSVESISGVEKIPLTASGKIDLSKIDWEALIIKAPKVDSLEQNDIKKLTEILAEEIRNNTILPNPLEASLAVPIFRNGNLKFVAFIGSFTDHFYNEDDISLAKLVISQAAVLFEKDIAILNATRLLTMGNMISEISHDLRRPLTTIKGGLQIIRERWTDKSNDSELFQTVEDEVIRMNELVRELVDFSNPNKYQMEKVDLKSLIQKASTLIKQDLENKNIQFESKFEDADWQVIINKNQILEIFLNLFINSLDVMPNGGKISVYGLIEKPEHKKIDYLALKISDTGEGIKKENLSKIFDRYFTTKATGTGLGLAVVERIISAHDGTLSVSSEYGKGTTFTIYLPLKED